MYTGQTVSLKNILWKVFRNPLVNDLSYEQAAEFSIEGLQLIGAPLLLVDKTSKPLITIEEFKGLLPSNIIQIRGVRLIQDLDNYERNAIPLTYATDIYHDSLNCNNQPKLDEDEEHSKYSSQIYQEFTYKVQKNKIFTSFEEGNVEVSYQALDLDNDGYPLIPNDQDTKLAIEYYILYKYLEPLWMMGKITDKVFHYIDQQKSWYMGAASSSLKLANMDHLEATMNAVNRIIVNDQAFNNFYKGMGERERIKRYN